MNEKWVPIPGFEGSFEVSDLGRVRGVEREVLVQGRFTRRVKGKIKKPTRVSKKTLHLKINLNVDGGDYFVLVHHLVLQGFVGSRPDGMEACHRNDIGDDNRLANLYWGTRQQNIADRKINERR